MQVMHDDPKNYLFTLVQSSSKVHYMKDSTHPLLDHHQDELCPLPRLGLTLRLEVVKSKQ